LDCICRCLHRIGMYCLNRHHDGCSWLEVYTNWSCRYTILIGWH
jgi:hypothetical protein